MLPTRTLHLYDSCSCHLRCCCSGLASQAEIQFYISVATMITSWQKKGDISWHLKMFYDSQTYRVAIISPGGPFHMAILDVKWEVFNRYITGRFEHAMT